MCNKSEQGIDIDTGFCTDNDFFLLCDDFL